MLQEDGSADTVLDPQNYLMSRKKPSCTGKQQKRNHIRK